MKNLIYILVDALSYDNVGERDFRISPTPFLDTLKQKSLSFNNVYTQAPYTEAAFVSTICGENVLDKGGYLLGLRNCENTYAEILKKKGYHAISTFSPYIMSNTYIRGVDEYFYSRGYSIQPLLIYRLKYYKERYDLGTIEEAEYKVCEILLEDCFEILMDQINSLIENDEKTILIQDLFKNKQEMVELRNIIQNEKKEYIANNRNYIIDLFEEWDEHKLLRAPGLAIKEKVSENVKSDIKKKYTDFLTDAQNKYNRLMKKNMKKDWGYLWDLFWNDENGYHGAIQTYRRYNELYNNLDLLKTIDEHVTEKVTVSAKRQLDFFADKILDMDKMGENYFAFIHLEDFHLPSMIYSYDLENFDSIDEDFVEIKKYIDKLPEEYKGNLVADLSAQYVDKELKKFYEKLLSETKDDFVFVVTADHGYPCNYNPPRPIIFNAFYQENYHIPLIINEKDNTVGKEINGLYSSMDIMNILLSLIEVKYNSISEREYVLIEYPGPGCPDIARKEIYYAIFDGRYKIAFKVMLQEDVTVEKVVLATDLLKDPLEKSNIKKKIKSNKTMQSLIHIVDNRHSVIKMKFLGDKFYQKMI